MLLTGSDVDDWDSRGSVHSRSGEFVSRTRVDVQLRIYKGRRPHIVSEEEIEMRREAFCTGFR